MKPFPWFTGLVMVCLASPVAAQQSQPETSWNLSPNSRSSLGGLLAAPASTFGDTNNVTGTSASGRISLLLELGNEPAAVTYARASQPKLGRAATAESVTAATRTQLASIEAEQQAVLARLPAATTLLFRNQRVYNGIAAMIDAGQLETVRQIPGVVAVHTLVPKALDNAVTVPLVGAPEAWRAAGGLTGQGVSIGIIDTGVDYLHADFGGPGAITTSLYFTNNTKVINDVSGFPGAHVVGGWDFVGDSYNADGFGASSTPVPDPDPMDCEGHGTHVAGTAAGLGVLQNGLTYSGPYTSGISFDQFRIGPGVAPGARIYALKIFGCFGTTNMADAALEWAVDPNSDGDFSDHLDVVNLSLGSTYGAADDPTAVAANNAVIAGVVVVASAGNSGDTNFVGGSPAVADRVIAVAASQDSTDVMDGLPISGSRLISDGVLPASQSTLFAYKVPTSTVTATLAYPITNASGCASFTITDTQVISGHIAFLNWTHVDGDNECGSATRVGNAAVAHARGVVLAHDLPLLDITIGGTGLIPSVIIPKTSGDLVRQALIAGEVITVVLGPDFNGSQRYTDTARTNTGTAFSSRGVRLGDFVLKPDLAAPGQTVFSARSGSGSGGLSLSGTSMAAPHVTGELAILKQQHPFWSPEELKALAMNTANVSVSYQPNVTTTTTNSGTLHSPTRMGAGRINIATAIDDEVVAYADAAGGRISINFGAIEALDPLTQTRKLVISNKGVQPVTFTLAYSNVNPLPGVTISLSPSLVSLAPVAGAKVQIDMTVNPAQLQHVKDPTLAVSQSGLPREWLSEETGLILLTAQGTGPDLRVPLYATVRPASAMHGVTYTKGQTSVVLSGRDVHGSGSAPIAELSEVSALELSYFQPDPAKTKLTADAELRAAGVNSDYTPAQNFLSSTLYFGVASKASWTTPTAQDVEFDIYIDTNRDGTADYVLFDYNQAGATGKTDPNDVFVTALLRLNTFGRTVQTYTNGISPAELHIPLFHNSVMLLPVRVQDLGLAPGQAFDWQVVSYARRGSLAIDQSPVMRYNPVAPAFKISHGDGRPPVWSDTPGAAIPATLANGTAFTRPGEPDSTHGLLLLHHFNLLAERADVFEIVPNKYFFPLIKK